MPDAGVPAGGGVREDEIDEFLAAWFALGEAAPRRQSVKVALDRVRAKRAESEGMVKLADVLAALNTKFGEATDGR